jgi:hypothetical protein
MTCRKDHCVGLSVTPHFLVAIELDAVGDPF